MYIFKAVTDEKFEEFLNKVSRETERLVDIIEDLIQLRKAREIDSELIDEAFAILDGKKKVVDVLSTAHVRHREKVRRGLVFSVTDWDLKLSDDLLHSIMDDLLQGTRAHLEMERQFPVSNFFIFLDEEKISNIVKVFEKSWIHFLDDFCIFKERKSRREELVSRIRRGTVSVRGE
ncbi:hypothetical protein DRO47_06410 [Candidatus Bathyarchaeota archaeon]|nr:MAG: hypothetical protein DRO47_06410 [Candidatus Bathyarchaeota archaeon]